MEGPPFSSRLAGSPACCVPAAARGKAVVSGDFAGENDPYTGTISGDRITIVSHTGNRCNRRSRLAQPYVTGSQCAGDLGTVAMTCTTGAG